MAEINDFEDSHEDVEESSVLTMVDVLKEQTDLEENAFAVLGPSDAHHCTYDMGYMDRQPLYACKTCATKDGRPAGVCLACTFECHEGHDFFELYTKRNFRCDCGNDLFGDSSCKLCPNKDATNTENVYNQNYSGKYCSCKRPYPDSERDTDDQMIQCIVCEDWFHGLHLGTTIPENDDYCEMICSPCMKDLPFLFAYHMYSVNMKITNESEVAESVETAVLENLQQESKDVDSKVTENVSQSTCIFKRLKKNDSHSGAVFWQANWRKNLCICESCLKTYDKENCTFLIKDQDTVHHYETQGKEQNRETQYEKGLKEMNKIDRVKSIEAIHGYSSMSSSLKDYLKKFADSGKVVREEDIQEFFEMLSQKRQRRK